MNLPRQANQMNECFAQAYNSGDITNLIQLFEPSAVTLNKDRKPLDTRQDIVNDLTQLLSLGGKMTSTNKYTVIKDDIY